MFELSHRREDNRKKKKSSHLHFKFVVVEELSVHCLGVRVDGSQENSDGQHVAHSEVSVLNKNKHS